MIWLCPKFLNQLVHMNFYCINGSFNTLLNDVDCYLLLRVSPMQLPKLKHYYSLWYIAPTTAKTTMASTQMKNVPGSVYRCDDCTALQRRNSLGKPPNIQLMGRTTKQAPVNALEAMMMPSWYLNVSRPQGMLNTSTNNMMVHCAQISKILENMELTRIPIMNPKTKLISQLHAPTKKTDTLMSLVARYPSKHDTNNSSKKQEQIVMLEELGLISSVSNDPKAARLMRSTAMNTVTSKADLPQKSRQKPRRNITIPKKKGWSWNTFQKLEIQSTGQPYTECPTISSLPSYQSMSNYETQKSFLCEHSILIYVNLGLIFGVGPVLKFKLKVLSSPSNSYLVVNSEDEELEEYLQHLQIGFESFKELALGVRTKEKDVGSFGHSGGVKAKQKLKQIILSSSIILQGVGISRYVKVNSLPSVRNVQTLLVEIECTAQKRQIQTSRLRRFLIG